MDSFEDGYFGEPVFGVAVIVCLYLPEDTNNGGCGVFLPRAAAVGLSVLLPRRRRRLQGMNRSFVSWAASVTFPHVWDAVPAARIQQGSRLGSA